MTHLCNFTCRLSVILSLIHFVVTFLFYTGQWAVSSLFFLLMVLFDFIFIPFFWSESTWPNHLVVHHSIHNSFHCHVQNVTIPCHSQELLPFLSVMYYFLPPFSTNYSILFLTSSCQLLRGLPLNLVVPKFINNTLLGILFPSILCTCPNERNLFKLTVSIMVGFLTLA